MNNIFLIPINTNSNKQQQQRTNQIEIKFLSLLGSDIFNCILDLVVGNQTYPSLCQQIKTTIGKYCCVYFSDGTG